MTKRITVNGTSVYVNGRFVAGFPTAERANEYAAKLHSLRNS